jgi:ketosteroid isomerase-like protein
MATKREIVEKVNAAFSANNVEGFLSCCVDDVEWTMVGDNTVKGKEAIRSWMGSGPGEPPQFGVDAIVTEGDHAIAYGDMSMKEDGNVVPYSYCDVYRFQGDRIATMKSYVVKTQTQTQTQKK